MPLPSRILHLKFIPTYPLRMAAGTALSLATANGTKTYSVDYSGVVVTSGISDPATATVLVLRSTGAYERARLDQLVFPAAGTRTPRGDANYTILTTDRFIGLTAALTAPRTWTLPAASAYPSGTGLNIVDEFGGITSSNTLTVIRSGSDTVNGTTSFVIGASRAGIQITSDGTSKWSIGLVNNARLANMATATIKGRATAGTGDPEDLTGAQFRDSVIPAGFIIDRAYASVTGEVVLSASIPLDNTIPQNTEGVQVITASITPKATTNRIRARFTTYGGSTASAVNIIAAGFVGSTANAEAALAMSTPGANFLANVKLEFEFVAGTTSSLTVAIRCGTGGTASLNGFNGSPLFGASGKTTLVLEEIKA